MTDHDLLAIACEQFLGKSVPEIKGVVLQTLEGHLRSILGEENLSKGKYIIFLYYGLLLISVGCCQLGSLLADVNQWLNLSVTHTHGFC